MDVVSEEQQQTDDTFALIADMAKVIAPEKPEGWLPGVDWTLGELKKFFKVEETPPTNRELLNLFSQALKDGTVTPLGGSRPPEEALRGMEDAMARGLVRTPREYSEVVAAEADASLLAGRVPHEGREPLVALTLEDGGGFSGIYITKDTWRGMKDRVDRLFEKSKPV